MGWAGAYHGASHARRRGERWTAHPCLPPSGPVRIVGRAHYQLSQDGDTRWTTARLDTDVTGGWDDDRLHPLEVVDAALANAAFAEVMEDADFYRGDAGRIHYDREADVWRLGSCGQLDEGSAWWRLAAVDPYSGEVLEMDEGPGIDETCNVGTWPAELSTSS